MISRDVMGLYSMLSEKEYTTAEALAAALHVSSKTVRNRIKNLNNALSEYDMSVESKNGAGYRLMINDRDKRRAFEDTLWEQEKARAAVPDSPEERITWLVNYLLHADDYVKLDDLGSLLYVSNKTLTANLREVEKILADYRLVLDRKPKYGIKITGTEFDKRLCIADNDPRAKDVDRQIEGVGSTVETEDIARVEDSIQECLSRYPYIISNIAYRDLVIHLMIAFHRMSEGHYVEPVEGMDGKEDRTSYQMAADILNSLKDYFGVQITESETEYIAIHLQAKETLQAVLPENEDKGYVVVSPEVDELVDAMLSSVYSAFRFDFRQDFEMRVALSRHLAPMVVRLQHGIRLNNPLLSEIKQQYALAYTMATTACVVLSQKYHTVVREDEIGYIALLFALALERKKSQISKKNILMVCATGQASSQLMQYQYQMEFGAYINSIRVCDVGRVADYDFSDVDYVFTTVPITIKLPVPVQEVEYFLRGSSIAAVKRTLTQDYDHTITDIYREELFLAHQQFRNKDEALQIMCDYTREHGYADKNLIDSVQAREEIARTAFGNLIAMPHPLEIMGDRPFVCVALLDKPIQWVEGDPDSNVQAIFLISVANVKNYDVQEFYQVTTCLFMNEANIRELLKNQTFEELMTLLQKEQERVEKEEV